MGIKEPLPTRHNDVRNENLIIYESLTQDFGFTVVLDK